MTRQPNPPLSLTEQQLARFHAGYERGDPDACWNWRKATSPSGYGTVGFNSKNYRAHRVSFEIANGKPPGDLFVCHSCDNRACVNPSHLWLGTAKDNLHDMIAKGRKPGPAKQRRDATHCAKGHALTPENTYPPETELGRRQQCRTCLNARDRARRRRRGGGLGVARSLAQICDHRGLLSAGITCHRRRDGTVFYTCCLQWTDALAEGGRGCVTKHGDTEIAAVDAALDALPPTIELEQAA